MTRGIIVDRDGTLIDFYRDAELGVVTPAFHPDHVRLLPGVVLGLHALQDAGYVIAIATNQPDAAKGGLPRAAIERTNEALVSALADEAIQVATMRACMHHPEGGPGGDRSLIQTCDCRKPKPGMLLSIAEELGLDRGASWMIGDTAADLGAAHGAGIRCALLMQVERCELCQLVGAPPTGLTPELRAPTLDELAAAILETDRV
jgi:D-glycero-D-manno-heptose 1,7-bisphosphate phosphatase